MSQWVTSTPEVFHKKVLCFTKCCVAFSGVKCCEIFGKVEIPWRVTLTWIACFLFQFAFPLPFRQLTSFSVMDLLKRRLLFVAACFYFRFVVIGTCEQHKNVGDDNEDDECMKKKKKKKRKKKNG